MMGDIINPVGEPIDLEDPDDRRWRHAVEGRLHYATVEAVEAVDKKVGEALKKLDLIEGWLKGGFTPEGVPTGGVLQNVALFSRVWKWVLGLLGSITVATIVNTVVNVMKNWPHQ